jgi:nucleotide-binding universal stress UspA family protein
MPLVQRGLVGTDEGGEAVVALRWAEAVADRTGLELTVVEAFKPLDAERTPERGEAIQQQLDHELGAWLHAVRPDGAEAPTLLAVEGDPVHVIVDAAERTSADLVVIGSKPSEGFTNHALGSLAHALAHHLACPLVVVPAHAAPLEGGWIVVGVDDSRRSRATVAWAEALAGRMGSRIRTVHLKRVSADPVAVLEAVSTSLGAKLLVVAERRHHLLGDHELSAVADALLHRPPCPVAVLPRAS